MLKRLQKNLKVHHYVVFSVVLAIGIFNAVTALAPIINQNSREKNIVKTFNKWWDEERAAEFAAVGLTPDEKNKEDEFNLYREKYLKQNHTYIIEDRIAEMQSEYREWWEIRGGKEEFFNRYKFYPGEKEFKAECDKWIKLYTDKFIRYRFAFVPKEGEYSRLLTCWLLFPGFLSYLVFAVFFIFAYIKLTYRWGTAITLAIFVVLAICGGFFVDILCSTSFFDHYASERYMGASIALAFMLGATTFGINNSPISTQVRAAAILGFMLDAIINWFGNSNIFGAVTFASLIFFTLGVGGGLKIPNRIKTIGEMRADALAERLHQKKSINPFAERKAKTRSLITKGFQEVEKSHFDDATSILSQAMSSLLQEYPIDTETTQNLAMRMSDPTLLINISSTQWLEWGESAKAKNNAETAIILFKKGLSLESDNNLVRRAIFNIGELQINHNLDKDEGITNLKKVLALGDKDMLASQAKKMLNHCEQQTAES